MSRVGRRARSTVRPRSQRDDHRAQAELARERHGVSAKKGAHTRNDNDEERNSLAPSVALSHGAHGHLCRAVGDVSG